MGKESKWKNHAIDCLSKPSMHALVKVILSYVIIGLLVKLHKQVIFIMGDLISISFCGISLTQVESAR